MCQRQSRSAELLLVDETPGQWKLLPASLRFGASS